MRIVLSGRIAMKALTTLACCLFLASMLYPFVSVQVLPNRLRGHVEAVDGELWSFKETLTSFVGSVTEHSVIETSMVEHWFGDFWGLTHPTDNIAYLLNRKGVVGYGMTVLIFVFIPQILTLGFGALSLLARRFPWLWLLGATVFNLMTVMGIWLSGQRFLVIRFEAGFWLTLASAVLFSAILMASLAGIWKNKLALSCPDIVC